MEKGVFPRVPLYNLALLQNVHLVMLILLQKLEKASILEILNSVVEDRMHIPKTIAFGCNR